MQEIFRDTYAITDYSKDGYAPYQEYFRTLETAIDEELSPAMTNTKSTGQRPTRPNRTAEIEWIIGAICFEVAVVLAVVAVSLVSCSAF